MDFEDFFVGMLDIQANNFYYANFLWKLRKRAFSNKLTCFCVRSSDIPQESSGLESAAVPSLRIVIALCYTAEAGFFNI